MAAGQSAQRNPDFRVVLIGKTGNGKSSAGNTILGSEKCRVQRGMLSGTDKCDLQEAERYGLWIQVTDTPGVCDTHRPKENVHREIVKCIASMAPGPHAVLMCLRCDRRFTDEEYAAYEELKQLFGPELTKHMILVFSGVDESDGFNIDEATAVIPKLKRVVSELGSKDRYITLNNKACWADRVKQGDKVLDLVSQVVDANKGSYFSNDFIKQIDEMMQEKETEVKSREQIKQDVVKEKDATFFGKLLNVLSLGLIPEDICALM